jgi:hypothetical protein
MALPNVGNSINALYDRVDNPPRVFKAGVDERFDKDRHDEVYQYGMAHFYQLAQDLTCDAYRSNATEYAQFYLGSENIIKRYDELEIRQINLLQMYMQLKHSKLLADRLKIHYISSKNADWNFAQAMNQLFDWHAKVIRRNRLQQRIELCAPLFGTVGALYIPKYRMQGGKRLLIPGDWEYLDPRTLFFEPRWDKDEDMPVFAIRTVAKGRLEDGDHSPILRKRGLAEFERGSAMLNNYPYLIDATRNVPRTTHNFLSEINDSEVEVIRIWIKDTRRKPENVYYPEYLDAQNQTLDPDTITEDVQFAFQEADNEWGSVINDAHMPQPEENQWAHYVRHRQQVKEWDEAGQQLDEIQLVNLQAHIDETLKMFKDQIPDTVREDEYMFKGGWRYIKIIGRQVVQDGSIHFEYDQFPVALFHNLMNPESIIGISDIENLLALQDDMNNLLSMEIVNGSVNAYPTRIMPDSLKNVETVKKGPFTEIYVETAEEGAIIRNLEAPRNSGSNRELIMMLQQFMQMVTGATTVAQGEVPRTRTSGAGLMALQQQSAQRYTSTQYSLNDGWERSSAVWLAQIKEFWQGEIFLPVISPEYRESTTILNKSIDPSAHLIVERVSQDINFQEQQGATAMQLAFTFAQGGVPFPAIMEFLATMYDGSTVSRVSAQLQAIMKKPEYQQQMDMAEAAKMNEMMSAGNKSSSSSK